MTSTRRLQALMEQLAIGVPTQSGVLRIFSLARELIENKQQSQFQKLKFYADWMLHSQLDRRHARELLERIGHIVERRWSNESSQIVAEISKELSVVDLRQELITLFTENKIPTVLLKNPERWHQCACWLLEDLID